MVQMNPKVLNKKKYFFKDERPPQITEKDYGAGISMHGLQRRRENYRVVGTLVRKILGVNFHFRQNWGGVSFLFLKNGENLNFMKI